MFEPMGFKSYLLFVGLLLVTGAQAQIGGNATYKFLELHSNARINALGGYAIALPEADVNLMIQNPALLNDKMHQQAALNFMRFVDDISAGYFAYAHRIDSNLTIAAGVQYVNYGEFKRTNVNAEQTGTFTAGEFNYHVTLSKKISDRLRVGGTLKMISSNLDIYQSIGLAVDAGLFYHIPEKNIGLAASINNFGRQLTYYNTTREPLPLNMMVGFSKKFKHNPFRFTVTAHHLQAPLKLLYANEKRPGQNVDLETGKVVLDKITTVDKIAAHLNVSAEILFGKFMYFGFGYNHLRRYEMKMAERNGTAGFSWGVGMKFKKLQLAYGSAGYHAAYGNNSFSFILFINQYSKKSGNS
ncbi:MAG: type IX secretion system protein PorQ [Bacteroidia bacterium]|jgi:hypothetical protein|nr:type IX secretion system protein PorQ [Bacteroidia bacterium]